MRTPSVQQAVYNHIYCVPYFSKKSSLSHNINGAITSMLNINIS